MKGTPISGGISHGYAYLFKSKHNVSEINIKTTEIEREILNFKNGLKRAEKELSDLIKKVRNDLGEDEAEIFESHFEIMTSEDVKQGVIEIITNKLLSADKACEVFSENKALELENLQSEYISEISNDIRDIGQQLIKGIQGFYTEEKKIPEDSIVIGQALIPSKTASLDMSKVQGFIVETGGKNSHAAIIARSLEKPAIVINDSKYLSNLTEKDLIYLNGDTGEIWVNPDDKVIEILDQKKLINKKRRNELLEIKNKPAKTLDNKKISLLTNIGGPSDIENTIKYNADGIVEFPQFYRHSNLHLISFQIH